MTTIRHAVGGDLEDIVDIYNYYVRETPITFDIVETSVKARQAWLEQFTVTDRLQLLVASEEGQITGYAHSTPFRPKQAYEESVETTIYMHPEHAGRGVGTRLLGALIDNLTIAGAHRAYAIITLPNLVSLRLHEKLGFETLMVLSEVGRKFGRYWDTQWMERRF